MASSNKQGNKFTTKRFVFQNDAPKKEFFEVKWTLKRKNTGKVRKENPNFDSQKVIAEMTYKNPDKYSCTELSFNFFENLKKDEYEEIFKGIRYFISSNKGAVFVKINNSQILDENLKLSLEAIEFFPDSTDENSICWECPVTEWGPIFMCLGMSVGMSIGMSFDSNSVGMILGMAGGFAIGTAIKSNEVKNRNILKTARIDKTEPPTKTK